MRGKAFQRGSKYDLSAVKDCLIFTLFSLQEVSDYCILENINMNYFDTSYETSIQSPFNLTSNVMLAISY